MLEPMTRSAANEPDVLEGGMPVEQVELCGNTGMHYNPLTREYSLGPNLDVNYLMHFRRPAT
jgi:2-polyprenyl-6-hydroxyphenyl methylase/3-demethylubiquinone-9 3-methyltransferase